MVGSRAILQIRYWESIKLHLCVQKHNCMKKDDIAPRIMGTASSDGTDVCSTNPLDQRRVR
jgi:hypothetical protein